MKRLLLTVVLLLVLFSPTTHAAEIPFSEAVLAAASNVRNVSVASGGRDFVVVWSANSPSGGVFINRVDREGRAVPRVGGHSGGVYGLTLTTVDRQGNVVDRSGVGGGYFSSIASNVEGDSMIVFSDGRILIYTVIDRTKATKAGGIVRRASPYGTISEPVVGVIGNDFVLAWEEQDRYYLPSHLFGARFISGSGMTAAFRLYAGEEDIRQPVFTTLGNRTYLGYIRSFIPLGGTYRGFLRELEATHRQHAAR